MRHSIIYICKCKILLHLFNYICQYSAFVDMVIRYGIVFAFSRICNVLVFSGLVLFSRCIIFYETYCVQFQGSKFPGVIGPQIGNGSRNITGGAWMAPDFLAPPPPFSNKHIGSGYEVRLVWSLFLSSTQCFTLDSSI